MNRVRLVVLFLFLAILACNVGSSATEEAPLEDVAPPSIVIDSPASGSTATVGDEVLVQSTASDAVGSGVTRVDLQVDGVVTTTSDAPDPEGQATFALLQSWTPAQPGDYTLSTIAYRADGTASAPATITVTVEEATGEEGPSEEEMMEACFARANTDLNVRSGPGVAYPVQRILSIGTEEEVSGHDGNFSWYQVSGNGWVSGPFITLRGPCDNIQVANFPPPPSGGSSGGGSGPTATHDGPTITPGGPTATIPPTDAGGSPTATTGEGTPTATTGEGTPTATTGGPTPTYTEEAGQVAPFDNDSQANPSISVNFSPTGDRVLNYSNDISRPEGDQDDWVEFTTVASQNTTTRVWVTLTCTGSDESIQWTRAVVGGAQVQCGTSGFAITLDSNTTYQLRIYFNSDAAPYYVQYSLTVEGVR